MAALEPPVSLRLRSKKFKIMHRQQVTPSGAGFIQTITRSEPRWVCEFETPPLVHGDVPYAGVKSWLDLLEGAMNTFLAYDPRRPKPLYYMRSGGSPPATTVTTLDYENSRIQLSGLAAGRLTVGDYVSYQFGDIWRLYQCVSDNDGSGWVYVKPRPLEHSGLPLTVRLVKPVAEFKMLGDYEEDDTVEQGPSFKWSGFQFINKAL